MFLSADGQWLAAVNCYGDIYVFNLEVQRYVPIWYFPTGIAYAFLLPAVDVNVMSAITNFPPIFVGNTGSYPE